MKTSVFIFLTFFLTACSSMTLQDILDDSLDKNSSYDYNSSHSKKLDEMPAIGKSKCTSRTCRK